MSHYLPYEVARQLDSSCVRAICGLDVDRMKRADACGKGPILTLIYLAKKNGWRAKLLDYRNSGDTSGDKSGVVGYAAIVFYEPGEGEPSHLIDGDPSTYWHTQWRGGAPRHPHEIVIDFGKILNLAAVTYLPRQEIGNGRIGRYELYLSRDGKNWGRPARKGKFGRGAELKKIRLSPPRKARYLKFVALSEINNRPWTSAAEIGVICAP